ncbi:hypothetical protein [Gymnodinialimonas sp.]
MDNFFKFASIVLALAIGLGVIQSAQVGLLELNADEAILASAANILLVYFVLALMIERSCEVVMDALTALGLVPPGIKPETEPQPRRRTLMAILVCLGFAVAIMLTGVRLIEMILIAASDAPIVTTSAFVYADTILTAFILAGGSEGIHRLISKLLGEKNPIPDPA